MSEFLDFAIRTAKEAGDLALTRYWKPEGIKYTDRSQAKAEVDQICDDLIRKRIAETYPEHGILSEENENVDGNHYRWVFDPIDGTIGFVSGDKHWCNAIALANGPCPTTAVVCRPALDEIVWAEEGMGTYINGNRVTAPINARVAKQAILGSDNGQFPKNRNMLPILHRLYQEDGVVYVMTFACAVDQMIRVVKGKLDGYVSASIAPWDMAAAALICKEAGLKVTTVENTPYRIDSSSILVANEFLHRDLLRLIEK